MSSTPDLIRARQRRRAQRQKTIQTRLLRFGWGFATVIAVTLALGLIALTVTYTALARDLPSLQTIPTLLTPPDGLLLQPTRFYDRTGQTLLYTLQNPAAKQAKYLPLSDLPESIKTATRATQLTIDHSQLTIAQSLVSSLLLFSEPSSPRRDFRLTLLAAQLERTYGDDQILEWVLNSTSYGHLANGIDAAAWVYFDHSATDLTLPEAALLAAVAQAPDLNPFDTPALALERRQTLLQTMLEQGMIPEDEAQIALAAPLGTRPAPTEDATRDTAFLELVFQELSALPGNVNIPRARLEQGGLNVITTLDADLQTQTACALAAQLARLNLFVVGASAPENGAEAPTTNPDCEAARLLPTVALDTPLNLTDLATQAALLDPHTAQILALTGLATEGNEQNYPAQLTPHAPGTLLTPYIYLTAFTRGFSPASLVWDIPANLPPTFATNPNPDEQYHGPQRMRLALANDYLVPTLNLLRELGPENVWKTAAQLGLPSLTIPAGEAALHLPLEGGNFTLLEAAQAYGVFSNQGILFGYAETDDPAAPLLPTTLLRVEDTTGKIWYETPSPDARPVISAQLAYLLTNILSDETARWPSLGHPNALEIGRPAGVKLGTANGGTDTWAIGFTPQLVTAVWTGLDKPPTSSTPNPVPEGIAAAIWHSLLQYATRDLPPESWLTPPGISTLTVCDPSGQLPTPECPITVQEIFTPGSEPTQLDTLYRRVQINRETGLLATVFTPPGLIEERVYLIPPPEAADWAREAGLPTPPEIYDLVSAPATPNPDAQFTTPEMFASVSGKVPLLGSATGADFQSYQVQVGQGLNPQQWTVIGEASTAEVAKGTLASWDTTGLSGLYAIRLLVIRADQRVDTAILQVTVDNKLPTAEIVYPTEGQVFTYPQDESVTFQFNAADDLALAKVELILNNQTLGTFTQLPFAHRWNPTPGEYTLRVRATDRAGNVTEVEVHFSVKR
ncbi:MAG: penicillin-binding protein [Anaerolineales bacterium]|nr:penicillin-binding protein [Anaerolineales bacterium]